MPAFWLNRRQDACPTGLTNNLPCLLKTYQFHSNAYLQSVQTYKLAEARMSLLIERLCNLSKSCLSAFIAPKVPLFLPRIMCNNNFILTLKSALKDLKQRQQLLQQPELLQELLQDVPTRKWLFAQACQVSDRPQALKVRHLIVEVMQNSKQIKTASHTHVSSEAEDAHNDALAHAWMGFGKNFSAYDPCQSSFTDWFNQQLSDR
jgi:hypothetical protein